MTDTKTQEFKKLIDWWKDDPNYHKNCWEWCERQTNNIDFLKSHRDYIEEGNNSGTILGHGDRAFQYVWYLLVHEFPETFNFLEVGVYKAQILSLVQLISNKLNKKSSIVGVTILDDPQFTQYNRMPYIEKIYDNFSLSMENTTIIDGNSHKSEIIQEAQKYELFDCVYIDGDHTYSGAKSDILDYLPMLKVGGFFMMDDASCNLQMPPGIFPGIKEVSDALKDTVEKDDSYMHLFSCGHLRLFKKVK